MTNTGIPFSVLQKLDAICKHTHKTSINDVHIIPFKSVIVEHDYLVGDSLTRHVIQLKPVYIITTPDMHCGYIHTFFIGKCGHCDKVFVSEAQGRMSSDYSREVLTDLEGAKSMEVYLVKAGWEHGQHQWINLL